MKTRLGLTGFAATVMLLLGTIGFVAGPHPPQKRLIHEFA